MSVPLAYIGVILIWSTTPLAIKWSGDEAGFLFGFVARIAVAMIVGLALVMLFRKKHALKKEAWPVYLVSGVVMYVTFMLVYWGAQYISSGLVSVLFGLTPFFTAIGAQFLLQEKNFTVAKIGGMLAGLLGLLIIFQDNIDMPVGSDIAVYGVLFAVVFQSLGSVVFKVMKAPTVSALSVAVGGVCVAGLFSFVTWFVMDGQVPTTIPAHSLYSIIYLGVVGSIAGMMMYYYTLKNVDAAKVSLITLVTPAIALALGAWVNNEAVTINVVFGSLSILLGLLMFQWSSLRNLIVFPRLAR
jgi:drug/metabolite transporter (DMT)-like permease